MATETLTLTFNQQSHRHDGEAAMGPPSEPLASEDPGDHSGEPFDSQPRTAKHVAAKLFAANWALLIAGMNGQCC